VDLGIEGKVALVTAGSKGLGRAAAIALALMYVPVDEDRRQSALDVLGAALITAALGALTWSFTAAGGPQCGPIEGD